MQQVAIKRGVVIERMWWRTNRGRFGRASIIMPSPFSPLKAKYQYLRNHPAFRAAPVVTTMRLASWWGHCALGLPGSVKLTSYDARLDLPPLWRGVAKLLYAFREKYEPELDYLARRLRQGMVVVDVGACYGVYSVLAAKAVGEHGLVLAFEPSMHAFGVLERNIRTNGFRNVRLFRCALADHAGSGRLCHHADPSRNSLSAADGTSQGWEQVPLKTLDGVLEEQGVDHVDVLKIDAEGAEELILSGASALLRRSRPTVVFEVNERASVALGGSGRGAWNCLQAVGYRFFSIRADGARIKLDFPADGGNVVAVHGGIE